MELSILTTFLTSLLFIGSSKAQTNNHPVAKTQQNKIVDNFEFSFKSAHPKAQVLMKDDFYWSSIEETAPFGSDDGSDAAYGFKHWRLLNKTSSPLIYLKELIESWQYPFFNYNETDTTKIKVYINQTSNLDEATIQQQIQMLKEIKKNSADTSKNLDDNQLRDVILSSSKGMGGLYLLGQDNAIIGTAFAQFVLEGRLDNDMKSLTITAIKRQLLTLLINRYDISYRDKRKQQLTKMLEVINKTNS